MRKATERPTAANSSGKASLVDKRLEGDVKGLRRGRRTWTSKLRKYIVWKKKPKNQQNWPVSLTIKRKATRFQKISAELRLV